jgi:NADP-dependent 3-hydroxy acid dehydrogenase YdfG
VNNAGVALGLPRIENDKDEDIEVVWSTNVLGLLRMTRLCLPLIRRSDCGHIINIGSTAGYETYVGGSAYTASKHAVAAITRTLRLELLGEQIRVTEIDPGIVKTEFSSVRFAGDPVRAQGVFEGIDPLTPDDIADCIAFVLSRPPHVNVDQLVVKPTQQATASIVARRSAK